MTRRRTDAASLDVSKIRHKRHVFEALRAWLVGLVLLSFLLMLITSVLMLSEVRRIQQTTAVLVAAERTRAAEQHTSDLARDATSQAQLRSLLMVQQSQLDELDARMLSRLKALAVLIGSGSGSRTIILAPTPTRTATPAASPTPAPCIPKGRQRCH